MSQWHGHYTQYASVWHHLYVCDTVAVTMPAKILELAKAYESLFSACFQHISKYKHFPNLLHGKHLNSKVSFKDKLCTLVTGCHSVFEDREPYGLISAPATHHESIVS